MLTERRGKFLFVAVFGLLAALYAYRWITHLPPRAERAKEERVVLESRQLLAAKIDIPSVEIVDPLAPNRKVGKVYIYPEQSGWAVSGFYRRDERDRWHPYLMLMDDDLSLVHLKVRDKKLAPFAIDDEMLETH